MPRTGWGGGSGIGLVGQARCRTCLNGSDGLPDWPQNVILPIPVGALIFGQAPDYGYILPACICRNFFNLSGQASSIIIGIRGQKANKGHPYIAASRHFRGLMVSELRRAYQQGVPPILNRLGIESESWIDTVRHFRRHFYDYVGPADTLKQCSLTLGRNWLRGVGACRKLLGSVNASSLALPAC